MEQVILKRFEIPDEIISFEKGYHWPCDLRAWLEMVDSYWIKNRCNSLPGRTCRTSSQRSSYRSDAGWISYRNASRRSVLHPTGA
jgi:hypothetical protein